MDQIKKTTSATLTIEPLKSFNTNQAIQERVVQFIRESIANSILIYG